MRFNSFQRIALQILIILSIAFSGITASAGCGWVVTSTTCATDPDPHGAFCNDGQINCFCGADLIPKVFYDETDVSKKDRCKQATWWPPQNLCYPYFLQERTWEWQPDPDNPCCGNIDPCCGKGSDCCVNDGDTRQCVTNDNCPGKQTCNNKKWGECITKCKCCKDGTCLDKEGE